MDAKGVTKFWKGIRKGVLEQNTISRKSPPSLIPPFPLCLQSRFRSTCFSLSLSLSLPFYVHPNPPWRRRYRVQITRVCMGARERRGERGRKARCVCPFEEDRLGSWGKKTESIGKQSARRGRKGGNNRRGGLNEKRKRGESRTSSDLLEEEEEVEGVWV